MKDADLGFARVDLDRERRTGVAEAVYAPGKSAEAIARVLAEIARVSPVALATRATEAQFRAVREQLPQAQFHAKAGVIAVGEADPLVDAKIAVVSAGTTDGAVAEEAATVAELWGHEVLREFDVGVAGLHRLLSRIERIGEARAIVAVAGMDGALPGVLAGLVKSIVIAVPTSTGYGASFHGLAALLTMLNSCAPGVAVVNIDNGFGAAVIAHRIAKGRGA